MKSHVIALAALAAVGCAGGALAGEATKGTAPTAMTDEQLDQVTAGNPPDPSLNANG
jgi:hypothetical protein